MNFDLLRGWGPVDILRRCDEVRNQAPACRGYESLDDAVVQVPHWAVVDIINTLESDRLRLDAHILELEHLRDEIFALAGENMILRGHSSVSEPEASKTDS